MSGEYAWRGEDRGGGDRTTGVAVRQLYESLPKMQGSRRGMLARDYVGPNDREDRRESTEPRGERFVLGGSYLSRSRERTARSPAGTGRPDAEVPRLTQDEVQC